jgi:hypothetical protein
LSQCRAGTELAERDDRSRERHGANQDTEVSFDVVDGQRDARIVRQPLRVHEVGKTDRDGREADEAVQYSDQLRHLGHLDPPGRDQPDRAADEQRNEQLCIGLRDDAPNGRQQRDSHADDAVPVAAPRRLLVGQAAERQDEENGRDDVRNHQYSVEFHDDLSIS